MKIKDKKRILRIANREIVPWIVILYVLTLAHVVINSIYWAHLQ